MAGSNFHTGPGLYEFLETNHTFTYKSMGLDSCIDYCKKVIKDMQLKPDWVEDGDQWRIIRKLSKNRYV